MKRLLDIPAQYSVSFQVNGNLVRQLRYPEYSGQVNVRRLILDGKQVYLLKRSDRSRVWITASSPPTIGYYGDILKVHVDTLDDLDAAFAPEVKKTWTATSECVVDSALAPNSADQARKSWQNGFSYRAEVPERNEKGLRIPQLGALHAVIAHWTVSPETLATIVMPTGTGKTEAMLALLINQRPKRIIVAVPTANLRQQIAGKFLSLGVLKQFGILDKDGLYPVVGLLEHALPDAEQARAFVTSCNVIVATIQALNACSEEVRRVFDEVCTHLFIDEAHHVTADTWDAFRQRFHGKPILQFTATPFRNDGKHIGGKMIYCYPLKKAQEEKYFKPINFRPVFTYTDPDTVIANALVDQLKKDLSANLDHLAMARVKTKERAEQVVRIYQEIAPEMAPIMIHSGLSPASQEDAISRLRTRQSRIIVCVNMLGEGFDLPQLKIAGLHDLHMSLAVSLQFIGRFTRVSDDTIGDATFIANRARIARSDIQKELLDLYAEDADWNVVIKDLSQEATGEQVDESALRHAFTSLPAEVLIQNLDIKMSTVVYRTATGNWNPNIVTRMYRDDQLLTKRPAINNQHKLLWFVTEEHAPVTWGKMRDLENVTYHLYVVHWDEHRQLLFVNSSNNDSLHERLARSVADADVQIISGPDVYRAMHGIERLLPTNMGLSDHLSRTMRFMLLVGADLTEGLDSVQNKTKSKTNIFGFGFENGDRASIGCSLKGRIWSFMATNNIQDWLSWCHSVGDKLLDESITSDDVFAGFIRPQYVRERPNLVPLAIEWPLEFLTQDQEKVTVVIGNKEALFYDAELEIHDHDRNSPVRFSVSIEGAGAGYEIEFSEEGTKYVAIENEAYIRIGRRQEPLSEWFKRFKPKIHFEKDTFIEHDYLLQINRPIPAFATENLNTWDWTGTDLKKESQKEEKRPDSIQFRVIQTLLVAGNTWDFVFDDDGSGEIADVVALRMTEDRLIVNLYHCKFSKEPTKGHRIDDLYAVCGQAQKSIKWRERFGLEQLIPHLIDRERDRTESGKQSRIEKGDLTTLDMIGSRLQILKPEFNIHIVQPGVSKAEVTPDILELLAATSLYLHSTFRARFDVIINT